MKLPNAQNAAVDSEKVEKYLLNPAHPDNGGKFQFFTGLGFLSEHASDGGGIESGGGGQ